MMTTALLGVMAAATVPIHDISLKPDDILHEKHDHGTVAESSVPEASMCLADPYCTKGVSSFTLEGKNYCGNNCGAIQNWGPAYKFGYGQCSEGQEGVGTKFALALTPKCSDPPEDVDGALAGPSAAMCLASEAGCPLGIASAFINTYSATATSGVPVCHNCLSTISISNGQVDCKHDVNSNSTTFVLGALPPCNPALPLWGPPPAPPPPPRPPPRRALTCSEACWTQSGCDYCGNKCYFSGPKGGCQYCGQWTLNTTRGTNCTAPPPSSSSCFAKDTTTACLLASADAKCEHVLMADLAVGDLVLGREGATAVVAVQHKAVDTISEMLTFHTAAGAVSMTPDHAVFADGELVAAAQVKVGSLLSTGAVKRITKGEAYIINPVTASGTIVADGVLAASNPMWIASLTVDAPLTRMLVNAAIYAAGDVDSIASGVASILAKLAVATAVAKLAFTVRPVSLRAINRGAA